MRFVGEREGRNKYTKMAQQAELAVSLRTVTGKKTKRLRKVGIIPANIYGHHEASQTVQVDAAAFDGLRRAHQTTGIIALRMEDGTVPQTVLVRRVQRDPVTSKIVHIDFSRVSLTERISAKIQLIFSGEPPAVKDEGGMLLHLVDSLEVECAAQDLINSIQVDVTSLAHIGDALFAKDIKLPDTFTLLLDAEETIVKIVSTRGEATEEVAAEEAAAPAAAEEEAAKEE